MGLIGLAGGYYSSREFCREVGSPPPQTSRQPTALVTQEQQLPIKPPLQTGSLTGHDWQIVRQLFQGGATTEMIHTEVTTALAKRSLDPKFIAGRLTRLAEIGWLSPDEENFWLLTPEAQKIASTRFQPINQ